MPSSISSNLSTDLPKLLRRGWTTGACATACVIAAWNIYKGEMQDSVEVELGSNNTAKFKIHSQSKVQSHQKVHYTASVIKDAGDDPDVTHGCKVFAEIKTSTIPGIKFVAGEGVGIVTKKGLPLNIGEPAINESPRKMIENNLFLHGWKSRYLMPNGWIIKLGIKDGKNLAKSTWNSQLGIKGGLSILGTSGIVVPYSCSAWLASIKLGINVAIENEVNNLSAATGKTSAKWLRKNEYDSSSIIDMGDFILGTCKQLKKHPQSSWRSLHIAGGPGKLVKCAQGNGDLHNLRSRCDYIMLADQLETYGYNREIIDDISKCTSMGQALTYAPELSTYIAIKAREQIIKWLDNKHQIIVSIIDRQGNLLAQSK